MSLDLPPLSTDLTFLSPLSEERAARLVTFLAGHSPSSVLDVGCGWGELLMRVLEAAPTALGRGIDLDEASIVATRALAAQRGVGERARFEAADARTVSGPFDAVTCIGASQIWGSEYDEYVDLLTLTELATTHDFAIHAVHEASPDEWDVFESGFTAGYAHWLADHAADHPDAERVRGLAASQRSSYLGGYRGILGLAYLELVAV